MGKNTLAFSLGYLAGSSTKRFVWHGFYLCIIGAMYFSNYLADMSWYCYLGAVVTSFIIGCIIHGDPKPDEFKE